MVHSINFGRVNQVDPRWNPAMPETVCEKSSICKANGVVPTTAPEKSEASVFEIIADPLSTHGNILKITSDTTDSEGVKYNYGSQIRCASCWIQVTEANKYNYFIFGKSAWGSGDYGNGIIFNADGFIYVNTATTWTSVSTAVAYSINTWYHCVIYDDGTNVYYFVNGVMIYRRATLSVADMNYVFFMAYNTTAYFDAMTIGADKIWENWTDGQLNLRGTPVLTKDNHPMADGWHFIPPRNRTQLQCNGGTGSWIELTSVASYVPSWAKWILVSVNAYSTGGYWYTGLCSNSSGGSGGFPEVQWTVVNAAGHEMYAQFAQELSANRTIYYYNRSTNFSHYPYIAVIGYK